MVRAVLDRLVGVGVTRSSPSQKSELAPEGGGTGWRACRSLPLSSVLLPACPSMAPAGGAVIPPSTVGQLSQLPAAQGCIVEPPPPSGSTCGLDNLDHGYGLDGTRRPGRRRR